ncbi:MAG: hypothetical protein AUK50_10220 [Comamonadaceae bacterium CG2_30_57_122]|nr:MAG: hypothetical protein AUK50_10220 [Comamonadaceae bacterium CG2_30_57_122]
MGVSYPTAWRVHNKLMQAMTEREFRCTLSGKVQVEDAYLADERLGGKVGRGSENKVAFVAAFSVSDEGHPWRIKLTTVVGFKIKAISEWVSQKLFTGSTVYSDGLASFNAVAIAAGTHESTVVAGRKPKEVSKLQWITRCWVSSRFSLIVSCHSFGFRKRAKQYLGAFAYRFNRRFDLKTLAQRLLVASAQFGSHSQSSIRGVAEVHC